MYNIFYKSPLKYDITRKRQVDKTMCKLEQDKGNNKV